MYGTFSGNVIAVLYFLLFQCSGYLLAQTFLYRESKVVKLLAGSVLGSVLLQWVPVLFAFFMDFTVSAHIAAAIVTVLAATLLQRKRFELTESTDADSFAWQCAILPVMVYAVFVYLVISGFEIRDGVVYSSQATYGDMSMHLGFITSIAEQQTFPPNYSILPDTKLSYPFLSDSISSSLYLWDCDIRLAYMLPMLFAGAQVMCGAWLLFEVWLKSKGKTLLAWLLYFLNGGFGFVYFLVGEGTLRDRFYELFHGFYKTPTNLIDENIRWVNMIVDILLPQRASLFGYAVLFFALYLLYRAVWQDETKLFPVVGLLGGALPMIHTHSFLALVLFSGGWLVSKLTEECRVPDTERLGKVLGGVLLVLMMFLQIAASVLRIRESIAFLLVLLLFAALFLCTLGCLLYYYVKQYGWNKLIRTWGIYLVIAGCLALPQLFVWTFGQATGDGFLRGYFNWANIDDSYLWFYVKNIGVVLLLFVCAFLCADRRRIAICFPLIVIWLIAELVVFQPNVYDNNKLLYVAYLLMCGMAADFMAERFEKLNSIPVKTVLACITVLLCTISAVLTIGRECVAEYQLIDTHQYALAEYVAENTEPTDKILTDTRHNNAVAVLTGRNIQCGSSSYLYYHGLDYTDDASATRVMYEECALYPDIFTQHEIDYIVISSSERYHYNVDEETISKRYPCVFESGDVRIYRVK